MRRRSLLKNIAGLAFLAGAAPALAPQAAQAAAKPLRRRVRPYERAGRRCC
jgi:hypothetical protein